MDSIYSITEQNSIRVLSISNLLHDQQNHRILRELKNLVNSSNFGFVLDLTQLKVIDSTGINFLLRLMHLTNQKGAKLLLVNASDFVLRILEMTKLTQVFAIKSSMEEAIRDFSRPGNFSISNF